MEEILYMKDIRSCYIREFDAVVKRVDRDENYVVLDRTSFYPLGGGQPSDLGEITWEGGTARIIDVRKKNHVLHFFEGDIPSKGTQVHCIIDWERRYSHMKMHTAQHLLSAVVWDRYEAVTVGNQIHADYSHIDFQPLNMTQEDIPSLEKEVNRLIELDFPVEVITCSKDEVSSRLGDDRIDLSRLPTSVRELRTVTINCGDVDLCPCAGTHIEKLSELGALKIIKRKSKGAGKVRIQYTLS